MNKAVIIFDESCKLCNNAVRFIIRHDRKKRFCFIPLGTVKADEYIKLYYGGITEKGTMAFITKGRIYFKSDAVLRILRYLDGFWPVLFIFLIVPGFIRDPVYDIVAKYRYKWFGSGSNNIEYRPC